MSTISIKLSSIGTLCFSDTKNLGIYEENPGKTNTGVW